MQNITRRAALMGATAVAAAGTIPTVAEADDASLVALVERHRAVWKAEGRALEAYETAARRVSYFKRGGLGEIGLTTVTSINGGEWHWGREEIEAAATPAGAYGARITLQERDRAFAAIEAQKQKAARLRAELGLESLKQEHDRLEALERALYAEIQTTPARTLKGVLAKLRTWFTDNEIEDIRRGVEPEDALPPDWLASIFRDLERLAGRMHS